MVELLRTAGITLAYQVVTAAEAVQAAAVDVSLATRLLDLRLITGDAALVTQARERADAEIFSDARLPSFLERLATDALARHERFGGSVYLLEPEIKLGLGGQRDLDVVRWAARARWKTSDPHALVELGVLTAHDAEKLRAATEYLWLLRNSIHLQMGSRSDRLSFKKQEAIASAHRAAMADRSVETLMSEYYRHARNVAHLSELTLSRAVQPLGLSASERSIGMGLCETERAIGLLDPQRVSADPALALRLYAVALERNLGVLESSRNVIAELACTAEWAAALRASREASADFVRLVTNARRSAFRAGSILSELHDVGLLLAAAEVIVDQHASSRHTVIEVLADDRPGLLFSVAQALHELGVSVAVAKIHTEGGRASDVFYVNEFDGARLGSEARIREVRAGILQALSGPSEAARA